jgi:hypothetical protein
MPIDNVITGTTIETAWGNDVANTVNTLEDDLGDATAAATASELVRRDAAGRAQVQTPSASSDIATKGYADALGTSAATASTIMRRDAAGRAKVVDPSASTDIATKGYADGSFNTWGSTVRSTFAGKHVTVRSLAAGMDLSVANSVNSNYFPVAEVIATAARISETTPGSGIYVREECFVRITTAGVITAWVHNGATGAPAGTQRTVGRLFFNVSYDRS